MQHVDVQQPEPQQQQKSNVITRVQEIEGPDGKIRKIVKKIIVKKKKKPEHEFEEEQTRPSHQNSKTMHQIENI